MSYKGIEFSVLHFQYVERTNSANNFVKRTRGDRWCRLLQVYWPRAAYDRVGRRSRSPNSESYPNMNIEHLTGTPKGVSLWQS